MNADTRNYLMGIITASTLVAVNGPLLAGEIYHAALSTTERNEIYQLEFSDLLLATLSVSWDMRSLEKYHCLYDPAVGPRTCHHMNTTSGQYEDFYQATMSSCEKTEFCSEAKSGMATWDYLASDRRICKHLITGSCEKEVLTEQDIRQELIDLLELKKRMKSTLQSSHPASMSAGQ
ncbi:MAG: hypothetical protein ABL878_11870 [Burkholderiales bacterium]